MYRRSVTAHRARRLQNRSTTTTTARGVSARPKVLPSTAPFQRVLINPGPTRTPLTVGALGGQKSLDLLDHTAAIPPHRLIIARTSPPNPCRSSTCVTLRAGSCARPRTARLASSVEPAMVSARPARRGSTSSSSSCSSELAGSVVSRKPASDRGDELLRSVGLHVGAGTLDDHGLMVGERRLEALALPRPEGDVGIAPDDQRG